MYPQMSCNLVAGEGLAIAADVRGRGMAITLGMVSKAHRRRTPQRVLALSVAALLLGSVMARAEQIATALGAPGSARADLAAPSGPRTMGRVRLAAVNDRKLPRLSHVVVAAPATRVRQVSANTSYDVPLAAMQAYRQAAAVLRKSAPTCHLPWSLLAAIGQVESDHGRYGGAQVLADGTVTPAIVGPPLDGRGGRARISDTDNGQLDGDTRWDRAVGPMQFLPSTWAVIGVDADQDGVRNPNDFNDAALGAGTYLCAMSGDLRNPAQLRAAVYSYNHSKAYVDLVLSLARAYSRGAAHVVDGYLPPAPPAGTTTKVGSAQAAQNPHIHLRVRVQTPTSPSRTTGHRSGGPSPTPATTSGTTTAMPAPTAPTSPTATLPSPSSPPNTAPTSPVVTTPTSPVTTTPTTPVTTTPTGPVNTAPTTPPKTTPPATTSPTPTQPEVIRYAGTLTACDSGWCLQGAPLNLGTDPDLSTVQGDYNGDGTATPVRDELTALVGKHVTVQANDAGLVLTINLLPYADSELPTGGGATSISPSNGMPTSS